MPQKYAGQTNPLDEMPEPIDMEPMVLMTDGRWLTRNEMIAHFNSQLSRVQLQINVHENNELHLWMPFDNAPEYYCGMEDD